MSANTWIRVDFGKKVAALRHSRHFRGSATNAAYSVADYLVQPLLLLATAPFLMSHLGSEQYGIWMLAGALAGTMGIFSTGLSDATVKYVSTYRGQKDLASVTRTVRGSLTLSVLLGGIAAATAYLAAPALVRHVFKVNLQHHTIAIRSIQLGGLVLMLRSIDSVFVGTLRAYERYAPAVKLAILVRVLVIGSAVLLVGTGYGVVAIMLATAVAVALGAVLQARVIRRIVPTISFCPYVDRSAWKEIFGFGFYTWAQNVGGLLFGQVDRFLIAAFLGTAAVAYYSICMQLAQPVHGLLAAAFNFLFPHISARSEAKDSAEDLQHLFWTAAGLNIVLAVLLCLPLVVLGKTILSLWMGPGFARESALLLALLAVAFCMLSINVVPHFTLLGLGKVRFVSVVNLIGGVLSLAAAAVLIPTVGLTGAAVGRLLYGPVITLNYLKVAKSLR